MPTRMMELQALRGVACLLVLVLHTPVVGKEALSLNPFSWIHRFGYAGVDLFFAISGFIITYAHFPRIGARSELRPYAIKRLRRILPAYWLCFVPATLLLQWILEHCYYPGYFRHFLHHFFLVPSNQPNHVMMQAWSLSYELMFYALFAFLFLVPQRYATVFLGCWAAAALAGVLLVDPAPERRWWMPLSGFTLEFLLGCGAAWVVRAGYTGGERTTLLLGLLGLGAGMAWEIVGMRPTIQPSPGRRALVFGIPFALILHALISREFRGRSSLPNWLHPFGEASYSIYLTHWPFYGAVASLGWNHSDKSEWVSTCAGVAFVILALAVGFLFHRWVEKPLLRRRGGGTALPAPASRRIAA